MIEGRFCFVSLSTIPQPLCSSSEGVRLMPKRVFVLLVVSLLAIGQSVMGQKPANDDPQTKRRKTKPEPDKALSEWLRDVGPIISKEEEDAFKKLGSNEERERFIENFWRLRDPDSDTQENEYREEYYERVAYVNQHFTSGIPGYKTDRGRIYLKYGKPNEVESHPSGGTYNRESYEGGGTTSTYSFERWWYRNIPGHNDIDIEFVDPTGSGEYRIARNPFEKDALLHVPGARPTGIDQGEYANAA